MCVCTVVGKFAVTVVLLYIDAQIQIFVFFKSKGLREGKRGKQT